MSRKPRRQARFEPTADEVQQAEQRDRELRHLRRQMVVLKQAILDRRKGIKAELRLASVRRYAERLVKEPVKQQL